MDALPLKGALDDARPDAGQGRSFSIDHKLQKKFECTMENLRMEMVNLMDCTKVKRGKTVWKTIVGGQNKQSSDIPIVERNI